MIVLLFLTVAELHMIEGGIFRGPRRERGLGASQQNVLFKKKFRFK